MTTTVRVSMDEHSIVFVLNMPESAPDLYTNEYFELAGIFPEKYVFQPQDTVPARYRGGSTRKSHTPPKTLLMKRLQRTFGVPYDTFVYFVENNPLALLLRSLRTHSTAPTSKYIDTDTVLPDRPAESIASTPIVTPTQNISTSAKVPPK